MGQYLRPTENHLPVVRYWHPDEFAALERAAYELGFESVAAGPLVRSSYHADESARRSRTAGVAPRPDGDARSRRTAPWRRASGPRLPRLIPLKDNIPTARFPIAHGRC